MKDVKVIFDREMFDIILKEIGFVEDWEYLTMTVSTNGEDVLEYATIETQIYPEDEKSEDGYEVFKRKLDFGVQFEDDGSLTVFNKHFTETVKLENHANNI